MENLRSLKRSSLFLVTLFLLLVSLLPSQVAGDSDSAECTVDEDGQNKSVALKYKIGSIASIFVASLIGVLLPILGKKVPSLKPESNAFFIIKAFAAGVILATGFIHVLPDGAESLTSPCLGGIWGKFPFAQLFAMLASIGTLMVDVIATSHYNNKSSGEKNQQLASSAVAADGGDGNILPLRTTHGHAHCSISPDTVTTQLRYRVISQVLELGIIVHSVIIGIALGANNTPKTIRPLLGALTFHQFFEGIGLGGCITQAKFKGRAITIMAIFFSLTTPVGIAIGIGISSIYNESSPKALIVQGIFNSISAGILICMAFVDLFCPDLMNPKMQNSGKLRTGYFISLLLGAGCMASLAIWA